MIINKEEIEILEKQYRICLVNSLAGFRQATLVGTKSKDGFCNLAIFNSLIHLGSNPALFGLISRPESVKRDTLANIRETKEYTLNFVNSKDYEKAHNTSIQFDRNVSEFEKAGFQETYQAGFYAPFVKEAPVKIGMKLEQLIPLEINWTILIIGSIFTVEIDQLRISPDGFVDLSNTLLSQGLDAYFKAETIGRLPYATP